MDFLYQKYPHDKKSRIFVPVVILFPFLFFLFSAFFFSMSKPTFIWNWDHDCIFRQACLWKKLSVFELCLGSQFLLSLSPRNIAFTFFLFLWRTKFWCAPKKLTFPWICLNIKVKRIIMVSEPIFPDTSLIFPKYEIWNLGLWRLFQNLQKFF